MQLSMPHDGAAVTVYLYDQTPQPRMVVQLIAGIAERIERFGEFAAYLNARGVIVGILRGSDRLVGTDGSDIERIFETQVRDERYFTQWLFEKYSLPVILFGHSYGSFLLQRYSFGETLPSCVKGLILCGAAKPCPVSRLAALMDTWGDKTKCADVILRRTLRRYEGAFPEGKYAWLTKNADEAETYDAETAKCEAFSRGFYASVLKGIGRLYDADCLQQVAYLPVLLIGGADDVTSDYGRLCKALYRKLLAFGLKDVCFTLYPKARHDLLLETDRMHIFSDIQDHLNRCVTAE